MAKAADIIDRDPLGKWEGGKSDHGAPDSGMSSQLKTTLFKEVRVLNAKVKKLTKTLEEKNLSTAERFALRKSLTDTQTAIKEIAETSKKELDFLAKSEKYQQDGMRKLSALRKWYSDELKKPMPESKIMRTEREEMLKTVRQTAKHLNELTQKDSGTGAGRLGTLKALTRIDKLMTELPESLQEVFAEQTEKTEELIELQRQVYEEEQKKFKKRRAEMDEQIEDFDKRRAEAIAEIDSKGAEEARRRFIEEKADRAWTAKQELDDGRKRRRDGMRERSFGFLDKLGVGKASLGTLARGIHGANNLRKDWREGKTGIQRYAQNRAAVKGRDASSMRFGLGNVAKEDTSKEDFLNAFKDSQNKPKATLTPVQADPMQSQWARYAKNGTFDEKDQDGDSMERIADALEKNVGETQRFNSRLLADTHKLVNDKKKMGEAANDPRMGGSGMIRGLASSLGPMLASAAPIILAAAAPAILLMLGKARKEEIEKDPNNKAFDDNAYARVLRGKADSVGQAAAMQQQKALKTLQPGTAKQYLEAGPDKDGKYLDGYSKQQLEDMAAGKKPDTKSMEQFVKVQTGAQKAAGGDGTVPDDNSDTQRMAARSQVSLPAVGSADTTASGAAAGSAPTLPGGPSGAATPGAAGSGGLIKDGMGKYFSKSGGVDTDGVNPQMQSKLSAMGQEYYEQTGKKINFNSAYRSIADQEKLYKTMPKGMAAKPGSSLHNFGLAVDIPSTTANELDKLGLLSKYGFERPIANEKWHVQPKGMSVAAARSGLYSADAPAHQDGNSGSSNMAKASPTTPSVTDASTATPSQTASASQPSPGGGSAGGNSGGSSGSTPISVASIPTFDSSDGMFLSLNMGVV